MGAQIDNQGKVSDAVNGWKEAFDTKYAGTRIDRAVKREELSAQLLEKAKAGELTEREYLQAKLDLAVQMLPKVKSSALKGKILKTIVSFGWFALPGNMTESEREAITLEGEIELLKRALAKLTPEKLDQFISSMASMPEDEFNQKADTVVNNLIESAIQDEMKNIQASSKDSSGIARLNNPNSIESKINSSRSERLLDFKETFRRERGVEYNPDAINDYTVKNLQMQTLVAINNNIYDILGRLMTNSMKLQNAEQFQDTGISSGKQELTAALQEALTVLCGNNKEKMENLLSEITGIEGMSIERLYGDDKLLCDSAGKIGQKLSEYLNNLLGGKSLEELSEETKLAYKKAYGDQNIGEVVNAYVLSQQEGVQNVKGVVNTAGLVTMIAGQLIPVAGQAASVLIATSLGISALGSTAVSLTENLTKAGGATKEDWEAMGKELAIMLASVTAGGGIGKMSEKAFLALAAKNCPKLLAWSAEVGIDAVAGLAADMAMTGQINLAGEGIAQLQAFLVGLIKAKGNFNSYLKIHAGKPVNTPAIAQMTYDSAAVNKLTQAGVSKINIESILQLCNIDDADCASARRTLLDTIVKNEKILNNPDLISTLPQIVSRTQGGNVDKQIEFLNSILNNEKMLENAYLKEELGLVLSKIHTNSNIKALSGIFSELPAEFSPRLAYILINGHSINGDLITKIIDNKNLSSNPYVIENVIKSAEEWATVYNKEQIEINYRKCNAYLDRASELKTKGCNDFDSAVLAHLPRRKISPEIREIISIVKSKLGNNTSTKELGEYLKNLNVNISDFNNYLKSIELEKIAEIAPSVKKFNARNLLVFANYHYKNGTSEFTKENLTISTDFTKFLSEHYVSAKGMADILAAFPATSRNIGELPEGWLKNVPEENQGNITTSIYNSIEKFNNTRDNDTLATELSSLLSTNVDVTFIGSGAFGSGYKISVPDSPDVVLKVFHKNNSFRETEHGAKIEPQTGAFLNENSDRFVPFYFGRVAGRSDEDAFLVTLYMDNNVEVKNRAGIKEKYAIDARDAWGKNGEHNIINGKIIDYGDVHITDKYGNSIEYELDKKKE